MAEKYEINFPQFNADAALGHYDVLAAVNLANATLTAKNLNRNESLTVTDIVGQYNRKNTLSDSQRLYLLRLCRKNSPEYVMYTNNFFAWYNARPDMSELYQYGITQAWYLQHPVTGDWTYKDNDKDWDKAWDTAPATPDMFWRVVSDYNTRRFREVSRDPVYNEGDLVTLRAPFIGRWGYDPYVGTNPDGSTPDAATPRVGTVMQLTTEINRNSRGGKGSRNINILWLGTTEIKPVPERVVKWHERKRRAKK